MTVRPSLTSAPKPIAIFSNREPWMNVPLVEPQSIIIDLVADELRFEVLARHRLVGEHQAALRPGAERDRLAGQADRFAAVGPLDDDEDPALVLPRVRRRIVE